MAMMGVTSRDQVPLSPVGGYSSSSVSWTSDVWDGGCTEAPPTAWCFYHSDFVEEFRSSTAHVLFVHRSSDYFAISNSTQFVITRTLMGRLLRLVQRGLGLQGPVYLSLDDGSFDIQGGSVVSTLMVRALDSRLDAREFDSRPLLRRATT